MTRDVELLETRLLGIGRSSRRWWLGGLLLGLLDLASLLAGIHERATTSETSPIDVWGIPSTRSRHVR